LGNKQDGNAGSATGPTTLTVIVGESLVVAGTEDIAQAITDNGIRKRGGGNCNTAGKEDNNEVSSSLPNSDPAGIARVLQGPPTSKVVVVNKNHQHFYSLEVIDYSRNSDNANNTTTPTKDDGRRTVSIVTI
jgi:hypothetical protein